MGRRKRNKRQKQKGTLSGVSTGAPDYKQTAIDTGLMLLAGIAAGGAGAALGKHSLILGVPLVAFGVYKKSQWLAAAGLGLTLSNGFQKASVSTPQETVSGFDPKQIAAEAKDRVVTFFKNFSEKLYLPAAKPDDQSDTSQTTNGLGEDEVTYFVNPYSKSELDMSAIDRVQEQIAAMNQKGRDMAGYEIEREF